MTQNTDIDVRGNNASGLRKNLTQRHISMIALSGTIGVGLTINSGRVLHLAGPGGALVAYALTGILAWAAMGSLGEMTSLMDVCGPLRELPALLVDEPLGLALGWLYWFIYVMTYASENAIAAQLLRFKYEDVLYWKWANINVGVWILVSQLTALAVNFLPVWLYGNLEYTFGAIKLLGLSILIFVMFLISIGKVGTAKPVGDKLWRACPEGAVDCNHPGFFTNIYDAGNGLEIHGQTGTFISMWVATVMSFYAYIGLDLTAVTAAESQHRKDDIKKANHKTLTRIVILYLVSIFIFTFNVPWDHPLLLRPRDSVNGEGGAHSPFMIAIVEANIYGLPHFVNALIVFAAWSAGTAFLYASSRTLHSLAVEDRVWPPAFAEKLKRVNRFGVPQNAVISCGLVGLLGFLATGDGSKSQNALAAFGKMACVSWLVVLAGICFTFIRFMKTLEQLQRIEGRDAPEFNRESPLYPYRTTGQPVRAWFGLVICIIIIIFNGWQVFLGDKDVSGVDLLAAYLPPVLFAFIYGGAKLHEYWNGEVFGMKNTAHIAREHFKAKEEAERTDETWPQWLWRMFVFWFT